MLQNKRILAYSINIVLIIVACFLNACSNGSSASSTQNIYYGVNNGLIYKNNSVVFSGSGSLTPDGTEINAIAVESAVTYFATNLGVYVNLDGMWALVGDVSPIPGGELNTMIINGNTIYVGGLDLNGNAVVYARTDNGDWNLVGGSYLESNAEVTAMVFNGFQLYAAVSSNFENSICSVYVESGNSWNLVGESVIMSNGNINAMAVANNQVYLGGFNYDAEQGVIYVESNNTWNLIEDPVIESAYNINSLVTSGNILYAGGAGSALLGGGVVYTYSNGLWSVLGGTAIENTRGIDSLAVGNNHVYAGGNNFDYNAVVYVESNGVWTLVGAAGPQYTVYSSLALNGTNLYGGNDYGEVSQFKNSNWNSLVNGSVCPYGIGPMVESNNHIYAQCGVAVYVESHNQMVLVGGTAIESVIAINSIAVGSNGIVYAGGLSKDNNGVVYFESNGIWSLVGGVPVISNIYYGEVRDIAVSGNRVYAAGNSQESGVVYVESGSGWNLVGGVPVINHGRVTTITIDGNIIYAGASGVDDEGPITSGVYIESGNGWSLVGEALSESDVSVEIVKVATLGKLIYAGVNLYNTTSNSAVYVESGDVWKMVGGGNLPSIGFQLSDMQIDTNGDVYVASSNHIYFSKGGVANWEALPYTSSYATQQITSMIINK